VIPIYQTQPNCWLGPIGLQGWRLTRTFALNADPRRISNLTNRLSLDRAHVSGARPSATRVRLLAACHTVDTRWTGTVAVNRPR